MNNVASSFRLDDRVALVTGGGKGIGKGICLALAEAGAHVVVAELDKTAGDDVAGQVEALGRKTLSLQTDVTSSEQVTGMVEATMKEFKRIDILVNNVGGPRTGPRQPDTQEVPPPNSSVITMTDEFWDWHIEFNLTSTFRCCREAGRVMAEQKSGNIINISSVAGNRAVPGMAAYGTPKAAVIHLTKILALELSPFQVRVNCITPMLILHSDRDWGLSPDIDEQKKRAKKAGIVVGRIGTVEDIALTALFLASDASSYITGGVIDVAGGPLFPADIMERFESRLG